MFVRLIYRMSTKQILQEAIDSIESELKEKETTIQQELSIKNKRINDCLSDQIDLQFFWENLVAQLNAFYDASCTYSAECYSNAYRLEITGKHKIVSTTDAKIFADSNADYLDAKRIENTFLRLKKQAESVLEAVNCRKYSLKNLSDLVIHGSETHII